MTSSDDQFNLAETIVEFPSPEQIALHRGIWIEALRSGNYQQTRGRLRDTTGFCCLGVAEDIRGCTWLLRPEDEMRDENRPYAGVQNVLMHVAHNELGSELLGSNSITDTSLTSHTQLWLGLRENDPFVSWFSVHAFEYRTDPLSALNDNHHLSLAAIAEIIADQPADWDGIEGKACIVTDERNVGHIVPPYVNANGMPLS